MNAGAVPGWLTVSAATLVAAIFGAGTVAMLLLGHTVPPELWTIDGLVAGAYFHAGPFAQSQSNTAAMRAHLLDTVNHAIEKIGVVAQSLTGTATSTNPTTTDGGVGQQ